MDWCLSFLSVCLCVCLSVCLCVSADKRWQKSRKREHTESANEWDNTRVLLHSFPFGQKLASRKERSKMSSPGQLKVYDGATKK